MSGASEQQRPFDLDKLFEGYLRLLKTEAEYFSRLTEHNAELGRMNETHLVKILRRYLPAKFGIGTGFIQCGGSRRRQSPQCDIIIYDAINNAPLYSSDAWSVFPIEMVYGVIEVKTKLTKAQLKRSFEGCQNIRLMAEENGGNKSYIGLSKSNRGTPEDPSYEILTYECRDRLPPRYFIFSYYCKYKNASRLKQAFQDITSKIQGAHVHGMCCLSGDDSYYLKHLPYKDYSERVKVVETNGFRYFLQDLPVLLDSMAYSHGAELFFNQVNLHHYRSPAPGDGGKP